MTRSAKDNRVITIAAFTQQPPRERRLPQSQLINLINFIHFQDGHVQAHFRHPRFDRPLTLRAEPAPCHDSRVELRWHKAELPPADLEDYLFENLTLPDTRKLIIIEASLLKLDSHGMSCTLPNEGVEIHIRRSQRLPCQGIDAELQQNGAIFRGTLTNFSASSLQVELHVSDQQGFHWLNIEDPANLVLTGNGTVLFTGGCRITKHSQGQRRRTLVLAPLHSQIRRFKAKAFRSERSQVNPSPDIHFVHPLSGRRNDLKVLDISGAGFAVTEHEETAVLFPGLIIPEVQIRFANHSSVSCRAQVIYRKPPEGGRVKCGLAILDMAPSDHVGLMATLHQAGDPHAYFGKPVDMQALWKFFFETGFIYPQKYMAIHSDKEHFKELYRKLYCDHPDIARHFIYQDKGRILGHMAMIRYFSRTWLIHHHAADSAASKKAGLMVLNQIGRSVNDSQGLQSAHMDYVMCFFRPENRFPMRIFGGAARHYADPKGCSVDAFAYFHYRRNFEQHWDIREPWSLTRTAPEDLRELSDYYEHRSGGLLLTACDLEAELLQQNAPADAYRRLGFQRDKAVFSLKKNQRLKAILQVNISDIGLNMSSLTSSIMVLVTDPDDLSRDMLDLALSILAMKYRLEELPVLVHPLDYCDRVGLKYEKVYNLWVLNCHNLDPYFQFCDRFFSKL